MIRLVLPQHLHNLAHISREIEIPVEGPATIASVLDVLEERYPMLRGTIRDHQTRQRRPYIRFFACGQDLSHDPPDTPLPELVTRGEEPLRVVGAMSGG
jgi:sulfur-carrier protein